MANPQTGRIGAVEGKALEFSVIDIGREFSPLIKTQRAYSADTRILWVVDALWRTITKTAR